LFEMFSQRKPRQQRGKKYFRIGNTMRGSNP